MKYIRGNPRRPVGTAVVYWKIRGRNFFAPGHQVVASTVVINVLPTDDNLLTATFPPSPFKSVDEMLQKLDSRPIDLIFGGEITFPDDKELVRDRTKQAIAAYNQFVEQYAEAYKKSHLTDVTQMDEGESLFALDRIRRELHSRRERPDFVADEVTGSLTAEDRKELEEEYEDEIDSKLDEAQAVISHLQELGSGYDFSNLLDWLTKEDPLSRELASLQTRLAIAVHLEKYEDAEELKNRIHTLQSN